MKCPRCDAFIPDDTEFAFCPNCGADVSNVPRNRSGASSAGQQTIVMPEYHPEPDLPSDAKALQPFSVPPSYPPPPSSSGSSAYTPPYQSAYTPTTIPTSTAAIVSLVMGIVAWFVIPLIGAVGAVIAGHMARREIRNSGGQVGGNGLAVAGLILGYAQLVLLVVGICAFVLLIAVASTSA